MGANKINIKTDHALLMGLFNIDLADLHYRRVTKLNEIVINYNIEVEHVSGKNNELPDAMTQMGETSTDVSDECKPFLKTQTISRLTTKLKKVSTLRKCPFNSQIISEDGAEIVGYIGSIQD